MIQFSWPSSSCSSTTRFGRSTRPFCGTALQESRYFGIRAAVSPFLQNSSTNRHSPRGICPDSVSPSFRSALPEYASQNT
ncbi:MAG: DUF1589 domain-containing protein [Thermoguttaceae bacterium]|nr:DUF1589 domain-containing protein [Thermoguttaceae bacterium]